jgi:hypothetical protein
MAYTAPAAVGKRRFRATAAHTEFLQLTAPPFESMTVGSASAQSCRALAIPLALAGASKIAVGTSVGTMRALSTWKLCRRLNLE